MIRGVMKKISSWFEVVTVRRLNRLPSNGTSPSKGTWLTLMELLVWITPPITTVPPSVTSTCVVACCVIRVGFPWTVRPKSGVVFSTSTFKKIVPSEVIWGITVSRSQDSVDANVVTGIDERYTTARTGNRQVREQRNLGSAFGAQNKIQRVRCIPNDRRRGANTAGATYRARPIAPPETELGADIACKTARCGDHTSFNFDFLCLAVKLGQ